MKRTVRQGSLAAGRTAYLFVVDASGVISDQNPSANGAQEFPVAASDPAERPTERRKVDFSTLDRFKTSGSFAPPSECGDTRDRKSAALRD